MRGSRSRGGRERLFLASVGFLTAVLVVRGMTVAIHYKFGPFHDISMGGRHIHHLVWGILLLLLSGYGWLLEVGTGAQGSLQWVGRRRRFEAMALFGGPLAIGVFGKGFFRGIAGLKART